MLTKKMVVSEISKTYGVKEEDIIIYKEEGQYHLGGKLGCVLPQTELGISTLKVSMDKFMESVEWLVCMFENELTLVEYINSIDWEV